MQSYERFSFFVLLLFLFLNLEYVTLLHLCIIRLLPHDSNLGVLVIRSIMSESGADWILGNLSGSILLCCEYPYSQIYSTELIIDCFWLGCVCY